MYQGHTVRAGALHPCMRDAGQEILVPGHGHHLRGAQRAPELRDRRGGRRARQIQVAVVQALTPRQRLRLRERGLRALVVQVEPVCKVVLEAVD